MTSLSTQGNDPGLLPPICPTSCAATQADFRPATSADVTPSMLLGIAYGLNLEDGVGYSSGPQPADGIFGGLNSTLRLPPAGLPIGVGGSVGVNFKLYYTTSGLTGFYWITPQTKP